LARAASRTKSKKRDRQQEKITQNRPFHSGRRRVLLFSILLAVATVALYLPVHHHPFLNYDDDDYVTDNLRVRAGLQADTITWALTAYDAANWHPLTWLSHALDCQFFALDPAGHHDTNVLLHVVNVLLLFWVLARATGWLNRSAFVAGLFALHPINIESVAWIAERKNLLSTTFFLLALEAWRWYASKPQLRRYAVVAALYALGLMAKPQIITFPFVLLLWDYWPLERVAFSAAAAGSNQGEGSGPYSQKPPLWLLGEKLPLLLLSAASAVVTMRAQQTAINPANPMAARLANALVAYVRYLGQAIWPAHLAILYPFRGSELGGWTVVTCALLLIAITVGVVAYRRFRWLPVGWFWFVGTLVPMIGVVQVGRQAMADRYAYLSFIGLFILIVWSVAQLVKRLRAPVSVQAAASAIVFLALAVATHRQLALWSDNVRLWTHATDVTESNFIAEDYLGQALSAAGRSQEAMPHFARAAQIDPAFPYPYIHMGIYLHQQNDLQGALRNYQKVIALTNDDESHYGEVRHRIFVNMASAYAELGDLAKARDCFEAAVRLNPDNADEWTNLGTVAQQLGDLDTALRAYSQAVQLKPSSQGYLLLKDALRKAGREQEARAAAQKAAFLAGGAGTSQ